MDMHLHSNMVRFIIMRVNTDIKRYKIYIPIWLDLLLAIRIIDNVYRYNLHSNMVRFIIRFFSLKYAKLIFSTY